VTSAHVAATSDQETPATDPEPAAATEPAAPPAGRLECRAKSPFGSTVELYLAWDGTAAKGTLRTLAPSGNVRDRVVRAERYNGRIIADDVNETDLVVHAATVAKQDGTTYLVLGGADQATLNCE
jgi:hypothetical protein